MKGFELLKIELPSLRTEMLEVKKCQHQILIFEIMTTAAIIGFLLPFVSTILKGIQFWPVLFFLSPLIIVIPCQYIIVDKAITINRICSYFKVLERRIASKAPIYGSFFGWETGCAEFRRRRDDLKPAGSINPTQGPNHFYKLNFIITAAISLILLSLMALFYVSSTNTYGAHSTEIVIIIVLSISVILTLIHQSIRLYDVLQGKFTILAMAELWEKIL